MNTATNATGVKTTRGRKVDPKSNFSQAKAIYTRFPDAPRQRSTVVGAMVSELGLKEATANVYFYNIKRELNPKVLTPASI